MSNLTDKQYKQLEKKISDYVDDMNIADLKYDLKRYMFHDHLNQPTWKLIHEKLIDDERVKEEVA